MEYMENEFLKVGVSAHGAELSQIYDKEKKKWVTKQKWDYQTSTFI